MSYNTDFRREHRVGELDGGFRGEGDNLECWIMTGVRINIRAETKFGPKITKLIDASYSIGDI